MPVRRRLHALASGARLVFFAGLPGTGKSLLVHQLAHLAQGAGRTVHLLQWDTARPRFEASPAGARYPVIAGVTQGVIRKAVGLWVRRAVLEWAAGHAAAEHLLIGETPLVGNRFVELARVEDDFLVSEGLEKGIMHLTEWGKAEYLYNSMPAAKRQVSGGSAANTAAGVASLGGRAAFVGKVADDELGKFFAEDLRRGGTSFRTEPLLHGSATARSMILITPDGERTMNTYLGACHELTVDDIHEEEIGAASKPSTAGWRASGGSPGSGGPKQGIGPRSTTPRSRPTSGRCGARRTRPSDASRRTSTCASR